jgi:hypothetical protein
MSFAQLIVIYAPMIYTAPRIMFWMRAYEGKWVGVGAQPLPTYPSNGYERIQNIMHRAV